MNFDISFQPLILNVCRWRIVRLNCGKLDQWQSTFFPPVPLETLFHSALYPQSCWCIIQVIHNYI
jgi:hypothetical protein